MGLSWDLDRAGDTGEGPWGAAWGSKAHDSLVLLEAWVQKTWAHKVSGNREG